MTPGDRATARDGSDVDRILRLAADVRPGEGMTARRNVFLILLAYDV